MRRGFTDPDCLQAHFVLSSPVTGVEAYGAGHINDNFVVRCQSSRYLLQKINTSVFSDVEAVMENIERVTAHLASMRSQSQAVLLGWQTLSLVPTLDGGSFCRDEEGNPWRLFEFVTGSTTVEAAGSARQLYQAALAFGHFQRCLRTLPGPPLHETIPRFHDTPWRYENLKQAIDADDHDRAQHCEVEIRRALALSSWADTLTAAFSKGVLPACIVHNDTKLNNVLFDDSASRAICVVDLDTVMPGLAPYDFGDLVRSALPRMSEAGQGPVDLPPELFRQLAEGFIVGTQDLSTAEIDHLAGAAVVMALEVGVRFLTDYLEGDQYFKTQYDRHNLDRAGAQLRLAASLADRHEVFAEIVESLKR